MKKRPHPTGKELGAGEFAAILNGDDGRQILAALKLFAKTIQNERCQALEIDNDEDFDIENENENENDKTVEDEDEDAAITSSSNKRLKEEWMHDSKDYNVPFVGTSIAKGDVGHVETGCWPTGLLKAYLDQSPLAMELLGKDSDTAPLSHLHKRLVRNKEGKLSFAIQKAHLKAIVEIITAGIPISILKRKYGEELREESYLNSQTKHSSPPRFLSQFFNNRFPDLVNLILSETGKGKGKTGTSTGMSPLAPLAIQIMTNFSRTTLGNARLIAQALDALHEGVLKVLLREPRKPKDDKENFKTEEQGKKDEKVNADRLRLQYKVRACCLELAHALLETRDSTIISYISTAGNWERKHSPGILYLSLRNGLMDSRFEDDPETSITESEEEYLDNISALIQTLLAVFLEKDCGKELLSKRSLADLLGSHVMQNLCRIVIACAPPLESFQKLLRGEEEIGNDTNAIENVGISARKFLLPLLASSTKSPFLARITGKDGDKLSTLYTSFIIKVLNQLTEHATLSMQNFIIHCLSETPLLLPHFFRGMQLPEMKSTFKYMIRLRFIGKILQKGPTLSSCMVASDIDVSPKCDKEKIFHMVLPPKLNKHTLSRAIHQNTNILIIFEVAKLIILVLERVKKVAHNYSSFAQAFLSRLPDIQTILATRSKLDPFSNPSKKNIFVDSLLCRLLISLSTTLPSAIISTKFDWMKLLPEDISLFRSATSFTQIQVLQMLEKILRCKTEHSHERSCRPSSQSCCIIIEVMMAASQKNIYTVARSIAKEMLCQYIGFNHKIDSEVGFCLDYEISLWIDKMESPLVKDLQRLLEELKRESGTQKLLLMQTLKGNHNKWNSASCCFSLLLSTSLLKLNIFSKKFAELIYQVSSRCLFFHSNPLPLATVIVSALEKIDNKSVLKIALEAYARNLVVSSSGMYTSDTAVEIFNMGKRLSNLIDNPHESFSHSDTCAVLNMRRALQIISMISGFQENKKQVEEYLNVVSKAIQILVEKRQTKSISFLLMHPSINNGFIPDINLAVFQMVALLCPKSNSKFSHPFEEEAIRVASEIQREKANISGPIAFRLMKILFFQPFVKSQAYDNVGKILIRLVIDFRGSENKLFQLYQCYSLNWIREQQHELCGQLAWEAWKSCTRSQMIQDKSILEFILTMECSLCKTDGCFEALLLSNIQEIGAHDFIGRCLRIFKMSKCLGSFGTEQSSILAKAVQVGFHDIIPIILILTTSNQEEGDIDFFLAYYRITKSDFYDIWASGFLDEVITSIAQKRDDELVRISIRKTLKYPRNNDRILRFLSSVTSSPRNRIKTYPLPNCSELLDSCIFNNNLSRQNNAALYLLFVLFECLPKALKNAFRVNEEDERSISFCQEILDEIIQLLEDSKDLRTNLHLLDLDPVIRACLKYSLSSFQYYLKILSYTSLKLVSLLLRFYFGQSKIREVEGRNKLLNPNSIWSMILSHSCFANIILQNEEESNNDYYIVKLELTKLLLYCTFITEKEIKIGGETLRLFLTAYCGGTTQVDRTLRRLIHYFEQNNSTTDFMYGDEMCRRIIDPSSKNMEVKDTEQGWIFLGDSIDKSRVYDTLAQFPRWDPLLPSLKDIEKFDADQSSISSEDAENENMSLGESNLPERNDSNRDAKVSNDILGDIWRGRGTDRRYDPSFLIPQILAGLEDMFTKHTNNKSFTGFAQFAQRLCDRGALSLSLASLCCNCRALRRASFATLYFFHRAIDSDAGKSLATWRDRPQLKMLLDSIQRSFVIQNGIIESKSSEVPKLHPPSALFLAKAAFVLSKPADSMYGAINKYFLRINQGHGAYHDMSCLPLFVSLFSSASQDTSHQERIFALKLLRDSFFDSTSYSMVTNCNATDFLLTKLSQPRLDSLERIIILQGLTRILELGDHYAARNLLGRAGLLSLFRMILINRANIIDRALLDLVRVAVEQGIKYTRSEDINQLRLDLRNLLAPLLAIDATIHLCDLFCIIVENLLKLDYNGLLTSCGVSVRQSLTLLTFNPESSRLLMAVCSSPMNDNITAEEIFEFCQATLEYMLGLGEYPDQLLSTVLKRVCQLVSADQMQHEVDNKWSTILQLVLAGHSFISTQCPDIYHRCINALIMYIPSDDRWRKVGVQLVNQDEAKHKK